MSRSARILVTGAGGFIGHQLVKFLVARGYWVRGVDLHHPEFERTRAHEFEQLDLRRWPDCIQAVRGVNQVFHLAANVGGRGFTADNKARLCHDNVLIDTHILEAARVHDVGRFLYTSSADVYPVHRQDRPDAEPLREEEAYPADAEDGAGWQKLFSERQCRHYHEDYGIETRIARFHNIFGPLGSYQGGRENAPAALCRKVAMATENDEVEIWGDGKQTRSYCYIDDCIEGIYRLMESECAEPLNIGHDLLVSTDDLFDRIIAVAGKHLKKRHDVSRPQGVRGRNSDNALLRRELGWVPQMDLERGIELTYRWIHSQLKAAGRLSP